MDSLWSLFFTIIAAIFILIGTVTYNSYECHEKAKMQGFECNYSIVTGCMMKVDGKWVDYDRMRVME